MDTQELTKNSSIEKKSFKSCDLIEHGFMTDNMNSIRVCSIINDGNSGRPIIYENYNGEFFNKEEFFAIKRAHRDLMRAGTPPKECVNCPMLVERDTWDEEDYIDNVLFAHWVDCNSLCIYCGATTDEFVREHHHYYDFTAAIENMIETGILIPSAKIDFAGGEPTVYPEFEKLLTVFLNNGFENLYLNTSGIKYSVSIEKALSNAQLNTLTISVDAGSKEVHKSIKRVNSYDKVWNNIKIYSNAQQRAKSKYKICLKYILVPGINDDISEIDIFLEKVKEYNIDHVALSLDMFWWEQHKNDDNTELIQKAQYFVEQAENKYNYRLHIYPWARWLLGVEEI